MTETWIDLPHAVDRLAKAQEVDVIAARSALLDLINADGVATRIRLRQGFSAEGTPDLDEPMFSYHWRDLSDLSGGWWETGIAEFGKGHAYRGIQVREADLAIQLGNFGHGASRIPLAVAHAQAPVGQKRGPKGHWDWDGVHSHIIALANGIDGLHPDGAQKITVPYLTRIMADWFSARHPDGNHPGDSQLRDKAGKILQAINQ